MVSSLWPALLTHELMELVVFVAAGWVFRARQRNQFFNLVPEYQPATFMAPFITAADICSDEIWGNALRVRQRSMPLLGVAFSSSHSFSTGTPGSRSASVVDHRGTQRRSSSFKVSTGPLRAPSCLESRA